MSVQEKLTELWSSSDDKEYEIAEFQRQIYRNSLYRTTKFLLGYRDIDSDTHSGIFNALQSPTKRKLICVPRGCFKSSIASVSYPIWLLLNNPNLRIMIDSELYSNSVRFLTEIKAHLRSPQVTRLFGDFVGDKWNESEVTIAQRTVVKKEPSLMASGIGAGKTSAHFEYIIADDMNSPSNSLTTEAREKVIAHYRMYTSLLEPDGTIVVIGTRYAADDLIGHILTSEINPKEDEEKGDLLA